MTATRALLLPAALVLILVLAGSAAPPPAAAAQGADLSRGQYLAEHVAMCIECHSTRDARGEIIPADRFMGGIIPFAPPWPNDWATRAPRIRGLLGYTDDQGLRLLTQGAIGRDGVQLKPPMPRFRMAPEDAAAVVAYLKSVR